MSKVFGIVLRILIYVRVSTLRQMEHGTSLDTQQEECRRLIEYHGHHGVEVSVLRDQGSGADPDRTGFRELCRRIDEGECDALYVHTPDRLAREPVALLTFIQRCGELGIPLHFVEGHSGTSDIDKLIQFVQGFGFQQERSQMTERTTRGKIATARAGRIPGGASLYGYDYDNVTKKRVINDPEAAVVKLIFDWYAAGHGVRRIVSDLIQGGMATKRNGQWTVHRVLMMLRNESYIGVDFYMRTWSTSVRGRRGKRMTLPREEWIRIEGVTPPIITTQLFEDVRQLLLMAKKRRPSHPRLYLLTPYLWCSKCGSRVRGDSRTGQPRRYRCTGRRSVKGLPAICNLPYIDATELETLVWDHLVAAITHPDVLANGLRPHLESGGPDPGREMSRLRGEMKKCQAEEGRLIKLYATGKFGQRVLDGLVAPVQLLLAEHERDLQFLENQRAFNEDPAEKGHRLEEHARRISGELASLDFDAYTAMFYAFGVQILVGEAKVSIELFVDPS